MASPSPWVRHSFEGGWATDYGTVVNDGPRDNVFSIPFLLEAENIIYRLDGGPRKMPGTAKLNSAAMESGAAVRGMFDYWISGTIGTPTQHRIAHVGTTCKKDNADGTFTDIFTGLSATGIPMYAVLNDELIIGNTVDALRYYDGSTAAAVGGGAPNLAILVQHKGRIWGVDPAAPSVLRYSVLENGKDYGGAGSGSINVDIDDGDVITGLYSYKNELWVFKGPYNGSIHRVTGSSPSGADAFALTMYQTGIGAVSPHCILPANDDLVFLAPTGTLHTLKATASFGDFTESALSRPIHEWIAEHVNPSQLRKAQMAIDTLYGILLITLPIDGSSENNAILMMDYRFSPPRWALWRSFRARSLARLVDSGSSNRRIIMAGGEDGYIRKTMQRPRAIDSTTSIAMRVVLPFLNYGVPWFTKTMSYGGLGITVFSAEDITVLLQADENSAIEFAVNQGGVGAILAPADDPDDDFMLDEDYLAASIFAYRWFSVEELGEWSSIQWTFQNSILLDDVEIRAFFAKIEIGAEKVET